MSDEQMEDLRAALRDLLRWVEVPDHAMGDADWRKREEAIENAQRLLAEPRICSGGRMSTPTFVPRYAAAVDTCDHEIAQLRREIARREVLLREWEERRERYIRLAEQKHR